jgi:hypothetical protein
MAKQDLRKIIRQYKFDNGLLQQINCSDDEHNEYRKLIKSKQELPEGVYHGKYENGSDCFYRVQTTDLTDNEISEYLTYRQLNFICNGNVGGAYGNN